MDDLRAMLSAAMDGEGDAPPETPVVEAAPVVPETAEAPPVEASAEAPAGPERDEHGRFKPKANEAVEGATAQPPAPTESAQAAEPEPQSEAIRVPQSLPAAVKAKFATLDPDVRSAFATLEDSVQTAKAEWGGKGQRLNRYDEIIGPQLDRWRVSGLDEFSGVQSLIAAQSMLDQNPVSGILQIARSYGLTPAHLAQAFGLSQTSAPQPGQEGQRAPTIAPDLQAALAPYERALQTLQNTVTQQQQAAEQDETARIVAQIDAFKNDPQNLYFSNVEDAVADILIAAKQGGRQMDLKEAYERACWADPTIRPLLLDAQSKASGQASAAATAQARKQAEDAAKAKAAAAKNAGVSVTGGPTPGAQAPKGSYVSIREAANAAMEEHGYA